MIRTDNLVLRDKLLNHLAEAYQLREQREPNHLSTYVYCLTRAYLDQTAWIEPTENELMLFAIGYGLQDVLTPHDFEAPIYNISGIIYRPDMSFMPTPGDVEVLMELKTTRKSAKKHTDPVPETWMDYMLGGCYLRGVTSYSLVVLYMMGNYAPPFPLLYCDTFQFTPQEITANWLKLLQRKGVLDEALSTGVAPTPFQYCYHWECQYCKHHLVCESMIQRQQGD